MLRNINFRSPLRRKGRLKIFEMLLFKTLQSQCIMPKLKIAERVFLVEKYFETKTVVRSFNIISNGLHNHPIWPPRHLAIISFGDI